MNKKISRRFALSSLLLSTSFVIPFAMSCSFNIEDGSLNYPEQQELMNSANAKQSVFDNWLTLTYTSIYSKTFLNADNNKKQDLVRFLTYLDWNYNGASPQMTKEEQTKVETDLYNAYKFYVTYRSSISTGAENDSSSSINATPSSYFLDKSNEWKKNKLTTVDGKSLWDLDINLGVLATKTDWKQDNNFKLMFKAHGTEIYSNVLKILLAEMYFLHANEQQIKNGTDYNKQTQNSYSKEYVDATSFDVKDRFYFLNKYLVIKNPQFKWSSNSEAEYVTNIKTYIDFNNLMGPNKSEMESSITPYSYDIFGTTTSSSQSLQLLRGFSNLEFVSTTTDGDLSNNQDTIKTFGYQKSGLFNNDNKLLYSFSNLAARQKIAELKSSATTGQNVNLGLPKISLKKESLKKTVREIANNDFEITFGSNKNTLTNPLVLELNDTYKQRWEIIKYSYTPQSANPKQDQTINVNVKYTFSDNSTPSKQYEYLYNFNIVWNENGVQNNLFDKSEYYFDESNAELAKMFPTLINSMVDRKTNFSYILRPLPIFEKTNQTVVIKDNVYMTGKYSLENTIWTSTKTTTEGKTTIDDSAKKNLVHWFILNDADLWKNIQDYYLFNGYYAESKNSIISSVISSLGIGKKTDTDRKNAGILF